ncbi:4-fold beta flower protein [Chitinophaga sp. GbtcB8]|uniref:4-fold beta flower protein n=1 Tax=Chitinophaga sp. GbtcB8 TaxID=2824753 RepID=UPI001C30490B|nr:hypothetical protein [Chitinophaga sp. GbtcB8]
MYISDKTGKAVAFIDSKVIFHVSTFQPLGIVLGNGVYSLDGAWVGKLFDEYFRNADGLITGKLIPGIVAFSKKGFTLNVGTASEIIKKVKPDYSIWVPALDQWDTKSFYAFMGHMRETVTPVNEPVSVF